MANSFLDHPHDGGETYLAHLYRAVKTSALMIVGGCACLLHGLFPFLFVTTSTDTIQRLTEIYAARRALMAKTESGGGTQDPRAPRA